MNSKTKLHSLNWVLLVALIGLAAASPRSSATDPVQEVTTGIKTEKKPFLSGVDLSADYNLVTDFNQPTSPRTFSHFLNLTAARDIFEGYNLSLTAGTQWLTQSNNVVRSNRNDDYFKFNDISLNLLHSLRFADGAETLSFIGEEDILVSEDSRYLGYYSVTFVQGVSTTRLSKYFLLKNSLAAGYFPSRYRYSPVTSDQVKIGDVSADGLYAYSFTPLIRFGHGFILSAALSVRGTHYMDQSNTYDFGNSYLLSYSFSNWSTYIKYINRGWADRGETNLWYVDQYRRLAEFGASVNF